MADSQSQKTRVFMFESLPLEIKLAILNRIPTELALDCKLVSKSWYKLVRSFSQVHLIPGLNLDNDDSSKLMGFLALTGPGMNQEFKYFEYNDDEKSPIERVRRVNLKHPFTEIPSIVGSCNGLICLATRPCVYICNPITRECVTLPEIKTECCDSHQYGMWSPGFGYISSTNEYKVLVIHASIQGFIEAHIYTLGSGKGWRNLGKFDIDFGDNVGSIEIKGVFANGSLYLKETGAQQVIFTFNLTEEKFSEHLLSPPDWPLNGCWRSSTLGVLDGFLYLAIFLAAEDGKKELFDIWRLEKKNEMKEQEQEEHQSWGWTKQFRLKEDILVTVTKTGGVITPTGIYDPKTSTSTSKRLLSSNEMIHEMCPHKKTFISLKEIGEEDTKIMDQLKEVETVDFLLLLEESMEKETERRESHLEQSEEHEALDMKLYINRQDG